MSLARLSHHCFGYGVFSFCMFGHAILAGASYSSPSTSASVVGENGSILSTNSNSNVMTLPLIPHHVQKRRQRRRAEEKGVVIDDGIPIRRRRTEEEDEDDEGDETESTHHHQDKDTEDESGEHHHHHHDKKDKADEVISALQVGALYQGYGTHYIDLWCGTPAQRQTVIVDTGSSVTAFPCSGCKDCGETVYHTDALYNEEISSSFSKVPCNECYRGRCSLPKGSKYNDCKIGMSYQEGSSWTAFEARDNCYVAGPHNMPLTANGKSDSTGLTPGDDLDPMKAADHAFELVFGCQTKLTGLFKTQLADGIMGMDNAREAFWQQMHNAGKMPDQIFTLCYARQPHVDRDGTEAGAMTLGGYDSRFHKTPLLYTQDTVSSGFYAVKIMKVYMRKGGGGDSIVSTDPDIKIQQIGISEADLSQGRTIVDSGTTDTYFTRQIAASFKRMWKQVAGFDYSQTPVSLTAKQLDRYPTIILQLQGNTVNQELAGNKDPDSIPGLAGSLDQENPYDVLIAIPPRHYMEYDEDIKKYVNRLYLDESRGTVLGANVMMGHDVVFDVRGSKIGWAESDCDYTNLVKSNDFDTSNIGAAGSSYVAPVAKKEEESESVTSSRSASGDEEKKDEDTEESEKGTLDGGAGEGNPVKAQKVAQKAFTMSPDSSSNNARICSSPICQGGLFAVIVVFALAVTIFFKKRRSSESQSSGAQLSELELQDGYRDDPMFADDDDDDDEMPKRRGMT